MMLEELVYMPSSSSNIQLSPTFLVDSSYPIIVEETILTPVMQPFQPLYPTITVRDSNLVPTIVLPNTYQYPYTNHGVIDYTSPLARHEINEYLRYKFLDDKLVEDYQSILDRLTISDGMVKPAAKGSLDKSNSEKDIKKKIDFIGTEILTTSKNMKILNKIVESNSQIPFSNLPKMVNYVTSQQAKYVEAKIKEMRKK